MNPRKQIWVHPDFARELKTNASLEQKDIIEYSKDLSKKMRDLFGQKKECQKNEENIREKYKFNF